MYNCSEAFLLRLGDCGGKIVRILSMNSYRHPYGELTEESLRLQSFMCPLMGNSIVLNNTTTDINNYHLLSSYV